MTVLLIIILILVLVCLGLQIWSLTQKKTDPYHQIDRTLREENRANRQEINQALKNLSDSLDQRFIQLSTQVEGKLTRIQQDNTTQLEKMRHTVDEKLQGTLEKRLGESFQQVSRQLEQVYKGLGEMQSLASGVGDLKKVLTNVKTRGTWGEIQLGSLLEQVLAPNQFAQNVITKKGSNDRVEFAIVLPGKDNLDREVYLPIDAKFPLEDYQKLLAAQEQADLVQIEAARKALITRVKLEAKTIAEKYLDPPQTTDYAFLYLPTESLYAEIIQQAGLVETLQTKYRVTITGPTTILATLNSFQMIFRTVAIQRRSSEVWQLLENIRTEFGKFGDILAKTQKKLQEASNNIELAAKKSNTISRRLNQVALSPGSAQITEELLEDVVDNSPLELPD